MQIRPIEEQIKEEALRWAKLHELTTHYQYEEKYNERYDEKESHKDEA